MDFKTYTSGTKHWNKDGLLHREDGPAIEFADGTKSWLVNGKLHRKDGPAIEFADGTKYWYINDRQLTEEEFNKRKNTCENKIVEIDGKKYKLTAM